jgi:hypothetical protein
MPLPIQNRHTVEGLSRYITEFNVKIPPRIAATPLPQDSLLVRGNICLLNNDSKYPL